MARSLKLKILTEIIYITDEDSFVINIKLYFKNNKNEKIRIYFKPVKLYSVDLEEKKINLNKVDEEGFAEEDKNSFVELEAKEEKILNIKFKTRDIKADSYVIKFPGVSGIVKLIKYNKDLKKEDENYIFDLTDAY